MHVCYMYASVLEVLKKAADTLDLELDCCVPDVGLGTTPEPSARAASTPQLLTHLSSLLKLLSL